MAGLILGYIYMHYYNMGDTWVFFENARRLGESAFGNHHFVEVFIKNDYSLVPKFDYGIEPRSALFCKLVAIINLLTVENYWLTSIYFSLFSFFGAWCLTNHLHRLYKNGFPLLIAFLLFPSVVFWTSGVLKESLLFGSLGFFLGVYVTLYYGGKVRIWEYLLAGLSLILLFLLKYYYASVVLSISLAVFITQNLGARFKSWKIDVLIWLLGISMMLFVTSLIHPNLSKARFFDVVVENNRAYQLITKPENLITYYHLEPTWASFLLNAPKAFFSGIYSPLSRGNGDLMKGIVIVENWILLVISLIALFTFKISFNRKQRILLGAAFTYIAVMAIFLALSTPSTGTLVRYKVGFQPLVIYIALEGCMVWLKAKNFSFQWLTRK